MLFFLSMRYNEGRPVSSILRLTDKFAERLLLKWSEPAVWMALVLSGIFTALFLTVEFFIAPEPILPSFLLNQKIPVLIGCSNALVAVCNLSVTYFFPIWFQTVMLSSASTAGGPFQHHCLGYQLIRGMQGCTCYRTVSVFLRARFSQGELEYAPHLPEIDALGCRWMMRRSGRYKKMNMIFGCFPFFAAILLTRMREDSGPVQLWMSIVRVQLLSQPCGSWNITWCM
jgi:hypothetical protein